jgi:acyl carrier protein
VTNAAMSAIDRLTPIFREIFGDPALTVIPELKADDVPTWDSLNHINLIVAVEAEFGFEFTAEELGSMTKVGDLLTILHQRGLDRVAPG